MNGKPWVWQYADGALSEGEYESGYTDPIDASLYQWPATQLNPLALDDEYVFTFKPTFSRLQRAFFDLYL